MSGLALIAGVAVRLLGRRAATPTSFGALPGEAPDLFGSPPEPAPPVLAAAGHDLGFGSVVPALGLSSDSMGWELRGDAGTARVVIEGHVPVDEEFSWFEQEEGATLLHGRRDGRRCHVRVQLATSDPTRELEAAQSLLDAVLPPHPA
jgi:hypothetical protein